MTTTTLAARLSTLPLTGSTSKAMSGDRGVMKIGDALLSDLLPDGAVLASDDGKAVLRWDTYAKVPVLRLTTEGGEVLESWTSSRRDLLVEWLREAIGAGYSVTVP